MVAVVSQDRRHGYRTGCPGHAADNDGSVDSQISPSLRVHRLRKTQPPDGYCRWDFARQPNAVLLSAMEIRNGGNQRLCVRVLWAQKHTVRGPDFHDPPEVQDGNAIRKITYDPFDSRLIEPPSTSQSDSARRTEAGNSVGTPFGNADCPPYCIDLVLGDQRE